MELGMIGLGKMGGRMALRLLDAGHRVVAWNRTFAVTEKLAREHHAIATRSLEEVVATLTAPRIVWTMLPVGDVTEKAVSDLIALLAPGDILIEGGNADYRDSIRRAQKAFTRGVHFLDCGTSGGIWGLTQGYCLMVGGDKRAYDYCAPLFESLAAPDGCAYVGTSGAGHFVKMAHNGALYGVLEAYGEGFEILKASGYAYDLRALSELWNRGSVVRSWVLELAARAFAAEGNDLQNVRGYVDDTGEGRWMTQQALETNVPAPVITLALMTRFASRQDKSFAAQVIAALRQQFGGHAVRRG